MDRQKIWLIVGFLLGISGGLVTGITFRHLQQEQGHVSQASGEDTTTLDATPDKSSQSQAKDMLQRVRRETQVLNTQADQLNNKIKEQEVMLKLLKAQGFDESTEEHATVAKKTQSLRDQAQMVKEVIQKASLIEKQLSGLLIESSTEISRSYRDQERIIRQAGMLLEGFNMESGSTIRQSDWDRSVGDPE